MFGNVLIKILSSARDVARSWLTIVRELWDGPASAPCNNGPAPEYSDVNFSIESLMVSRVVLRSVLSPSSNLRKSLQDFSWSPDLNIGRRGGFIFCSAGSIFLSASSLEGDIGSSVFAVGST